jgi:glutaredoxin
MECVTVYSTPTCMQCKVLKGYLDRENLPYEEVNVEEEMGMLNELSELGFAGLPVVKFGDDGYYTMSEFIGKLGVIG